MTTQDQTAQKRREKILARGTKGQYEEDDDSGSIQANSPQSNSVFQRFRKLKDRQKMEQKLTDVSKGAGLIIVILANFLPPEAVFSAVTAIMVVFALRISESKNKGSGLKWMGKAGDILGKFQHVERFLFVGRIALNVMLSYILAAVLVNILLSSSSHLLDEL